MSYADHLRDRARHYADMSSRLLCVDTDGAAILGLLAMRNYRLADKMEVR